MRYRTECVPKIGVHFTIINCKCISSRMGTCQALHVASITKMGCIMGIVKRKGFEKVKNKIFYVILVYYCVLIDTTTTT